MKAKIKLKPCPFCNNTNVVLGTSKELHGDGNDFEFAVCCDINNGGCGACSGYSIDTITTIKRWNRRARYENKNTCV